MSSTGEVACFGKTHHDAFLKSMMSTGMRMPKKNILVSMQERLFAEAVPAVRKLQELGYTLFATKKTSAYLEEQGVNGITGDCGFMMNFQPLVRTITKLPVYMSSLCFSYSSSM